MSSRTSATQDRTPEHPTGDAVTREHITGYVKAAYAASGRVPSVRQLMSFFHISSTRFYRLVGGLEELCKEARVPVPDANLKSTKAASAAKRRPDDNELEFQKRVVRGINEGRTLLSIGAEEGNPDEIVRIVNVLDPYIDEPQDILNFLETYCKDKFPMFHDEVLKLVEGKDNEGVEMGPLAAAVIFLVSRIETAVDVIGHQLREIKELKGRLGIAA